MKTLKFVIITLAVAIPISCVEENIYHSDNETQMSVRDNIQTRSTSLSSSYDTLPNPYALSVMQEVYDRYSETEITLKATDLYVKFKPKDSLELHSLIFDYELELFNHPLDIELEEGEDFINTNLPETDLVWLYTTVKPDFNFPPNIAYEILEECYIPKDDETVGIPTKSGEINVEDAAFRLMGYTESISETARSSAYPSGTLLVKNNSNNSYEPIAGIKVKCHRLIKWATAYTDDSGSYVIEKNFRYKPYYTMVFENENDFSIWGNWGPIGYATYQMGKHSNTGHSTVIEADHTAWKWAVVNNSANAYYNMCKRTGINTPPSDLIIWVWKNAENSSAAMLPRIKDFIGLNINNNLVNLYANLFYGIPATYLNQTLKNVLPDITIGTLNKVYGEIYRVVNHELAHASHFTKVGSHFWSKYISYIMTYGAYGNGTGLNAELCGIGEMWGYAMGEIENAERSSTLRGNYPGTPDRDLDGMPDPESLWIYPHIFWDLYVNGILTKQQIFACLQANCDTYDELVSTLYLYYPSQARLIEAILNRYPNFTHNITLPDTDNIVYDVLYIGQEFSQSTNISGDNIYLKNSTIKQNSNVTINANNIIHIDSGFFVENNAQLTLSLTN